MDSAGNFSENVDEEGFGVALLLIAGLKDR